MFTITGIQASASCVGCSKSVADVYIVEGQGLTRNLCPSCLKKIVKVFSPPSPCSTDTRGLQANAPIPPKT